jgi:CHAD domain-containing protein
VIVLQLVGECEDSSALQTRLLRAADWLLTMRGMMQFRTELLSISQEDLEAALKFFSRQCRALERGLRTLSISREYDPKATHQARVRSRKITASARLLRHSGVPLPDKKLRQLLGRLRQGSGELRDADARLAALLAATPEKAASRESWSFLTGAVRAAQSQACHDFLAAFRPLALKLHSALRQMQRRARDRTRSLLKSPDVKNLRRWLKRQLGRWQRRLEAGRADLGRLHPLRIQTKKLRYLAEAISTPRKSHLPHLLDRLEQLQDALGAIHDRQLILHWLGQLETTLTQDQTLDPRSWRPALKRWSTICQSEIRKHHRTMIRLRQE